MKGNGIKEEKKVDGVWKKMIFFAFSSFAIGEHTIEHEVSVGFPGSR